MRARQKQIALINRYGLRIQNDTTTATSMAGNLTARHNKALTKLKSIAVIAGLIMAKKNTDIHISRTESYNNVENFLCVCSEWQERSKKKRWARTLSTLWTRRRTKWDVRICITAQQQHGHSELIRNSDDNTTCCNSNRPQKRADKRKRPKQQQHWLWTTATSQSGPARN